jgi:hypothetical protein
LDRKSIPSQKIIFVLISTILFVTVLFLKNLEPKNVRGNWGPVVLIFIATMVHFLLRKETPEDHYRVRAGKYATPKAVEEWSNFLEERRKTHEHALKPPRLATEPNLAVPFLFVIIPFILSIISLVLIPGVTPTLIVPLIFSMILLALGLRSLHSKRIIDDTPTLKAMGVFIGKVELHGTAESENPLTSYLTDTKCVQYSWSIMEQNAALSWVTIASGGESSTFYLMDETGAVRIDPRNALVISDTVIDSNLDRNNPLYYEKGIPKGLTESRHRRIFKETLIPLHALLYVFGEARERKDRIAAEIAYDEEDPLYIISTKGEKQVSQEYMNRFLVLSVIGFLITIIFPRLAVGGRFIPVSIFVIGLFFGWWLVVYNSLVNLRNDVDRAWSTIDVQLNRRSDLIPNLVEIIEGYKEHEEYIQSQIATLRAQSMNPETPIGVASLIHSIAEAYPELKAGQQFLELQQALEDTEQRIALARGYYNEQTRFYNTRLEVIPDTFVAQLGGLQPRQYWEAENFQRAQETIEFVS